MFTWTSCLQTQFHDCLIQPKCYIIIKYFGQEQVNFCQCSVTSSVFTLRQVHSGFQLPNVSVTTHASQLQTHYSSSHFISREYWKDTEEGGDLFSGARVCMLLATSLTDAQETFQWKISQTSEGEFLEKSTSAAPPKMTLPSSEQYCTLAIDIQIIVLIEGLEGSPALVPSLGGLLQPQS